MPRARTTETADRIRAAALELIAVKGVHQVSLREIAERVGVTKPALYYHFASRDDLVRSLVQPFIDEVEAALARFGPGADPRELLGAYFDAAYRHRDVTAMIMRDPSILAMVDLASAVGDWRRRIVTMLTGSDPALADVVRVQMAIGGLGDCTVVLPGAPAAPLREAVLDAACDMLRR
ncbi:putative trancscriptional regulator,TetR [Actinoplanes lobatus]|uniref:AcrR family transcriptional regulator n=1 Tax=Actinoplanes lobatus TaxID=113568 RepID=A0A7W7MH09_9ACTN|nr:TetR/AcrR family transcriptional regulator [Actinoplanes lobatus]MBB4749959.1 AcrR family transcriptional regulator [Actinoplanes lobatus]GGN95413.1 putative trancscriptional regulator,TetR [Actinoplanes lobatus]GIE45816.1 putative trancscriptional regulator,TetR [Actinoplanes lobatus]